MYTKAKNIPPLLIGFIIIGVAVGIILSLQIRANPVGYGSYPFGRLEAQKEILRAFSVEQEELKNKLDNLQIDMDKANAIIESRSSRSLLTELNRLKTLTGYSEAAGAGVRITLADNAQAVRSDFTAANENFVQATDLRDLVNALFLKDASAIAINGKRITSLTLIQPVFDSVFIGNFQTLSPFIVEAIGEPEALKEAVQAVKRKRIRVFTDEISTLRVPALEEVKTFDYLAQAEIIK